MACHDPGIRVRKDIFIATVGSISVSAIKEKLENVFGFRIKWKKE